MLNDHLARLLNEYLGFRPTPSQEKAIGALSSFISSKDDQSVFLLGGYAGTGKTTLVRALVETLSRQRIRPVLLAPTGRAAKVLASYTGRQAFTIHKWIYRQKTAKEGIGSFVLDRNLNSNTIFIVDEASMITNESADTMSFGSGRLLDDLVGYVYNQKNCRLILIGDLAQLPPVGLSVSPALNPAVLRSYMLSVEEGNLTDVVRQALGSGILVNATRIRNLIESGKAGFPGLKLEGFGDIIRINGSELVEELNSAYEEYGRGDVLVVTRSNKRANQFNQGIRNQILFHEGEITAGDLLMVVRNNYFWLEDSDPTDFIANGDIAEVKRIVKNSTLYGYRFADVEMNFPDYANMEVGAKVMLDTLSLETASLNMERSRELYAMIEEDYPEIKNKKKRYEKIREHPYFNALQIKFAYAVTCHKAQGGQWKAVFIDPGWIGEDGPDIEYLRWLYTAFTRATEKLYLVNFKEEFFG